MWYLARKIVSVLFTIVLKYPAMGLDVCSHLSTSPLNVNGASMCLQLCKITFVKLKNSMFAQ